MAQWEGCLLCKHQDWSLDPKNPCKSWIGVASVYNPALETGKDRVSPKQAGLLV